MIRTDNEGGNRHGICRWKLKLRAAHVLPVILLVSLLFVSQFSSGFSTDKSDYALGETIYIVLNMTDLDGTLKITTPSTSYRWLGELKPTVSFEANKEGLYVISLDGENRSVLVTGTSTAGTSLLSQEGNVSERLPSGNSSLALPRTPLSPEGTSILSQKNLTQNLHNVLDALPIGKGDGETLPSSLHLFPGRPRPSSVRIAPDDAATRQVKERAHKALKKDRPLAIALSFAADEEVTLNIEDADPELETRIGAAITAGQVSESLFARQFIARALGVRTGSSRFAVSKASLAQHGVSLKLERSTGEEMGNEVLVERLAVGGLVVRLPERQDMRPGFYRLTISDDSGALVEQWFAYGLVSINTEHPLYKPDSEVSLIMVVLDASGFPVANAPLAITIIDPAGGISSLSTADGTIISSSQRGVYVANYHAALVGRHNITAETWLDGHGVVSTTFFETRKSFPYDIRRFVPATIDPNRGPFRNEFSISSLEGAASSYSLLEYLPASFLITHTNADDIRLLNESYVLAWYNITSEIVPYYEAQAPLLSPYLYRLGQAEIAYVDPTTGEALLFTEARPWLFAIDPAALSCSSSPCDTSTLVDGRDTITGGAEPNQPNTIDSCTDGTSGAYHSDESLDRIVIADLNRTTFTARDTVQVNITVWCWGTADNLNWVYTNDSASPSWRVLSSTNCPSGGSLQTFSSSFPLDDVPGNHTIRGVFQYNGVSSATCGGGGYDDNDDVTLAVRDRDRTGPVHHSLVVNQTTVPINGSVKVIADVTDNVAVAGVNATITAPNGTRTNLTLLLTNVTTSTSSADLEAGTITYEAVTTPSGYAKVAQGLVTFSSAQASQTITINPVNLSHAFIIVSSTADARSNADRFTYTGTFVNSTAITLARSATGTSGSAAYYIVDASNSNVTNGTTAFAATNTTIDVTVPDQGADYATKTFVVLSVQSQSSSRSYVNEAYVTGVLTSATNLRLQRDD